MVSRIIPYFHPTTVGFVDDNYRFIQNLLNEAPDDMMAKAFCSPEDALSWINVPHPREALVNTSYTHENGSIHFDISAIQQEIKQRDRFQRVSVMVVDYAMPTMNGMDFCAKVLDSDIRRLLLTSYDDEYIAVEAFNRGIIHRYAPKATLNSVADVFAHVEELQRQYFAQYGRRIAFSITNDERQFHWMREVEDYVRDLQRKLNAVEFYLLEEPRGYLFLNRFGGATRLIVQTPTEVRQELARCLAMGAPESFRQSVYAGTHLPYLMESPGDYPGTDTFPWDEALHTCNRVRGWLMAIVPDPPTDIDFEPETSSFDAYMKTRDFEAESTAGSVTSDQPRAPKAGSESENGPRS